MGDDHVETFIWETEGARRDYKGIEARIIAYNWKDDWVNVGSGLVFSTAPTERRYRPKKVVRQHKYLAVHHVDGSRLCLFPLVLSSPPIAESDSVKPTHTEIAFRDSSETNIPLFNGNLFDGFLQNEPPLNNMEEASIDSWR